MKQLIVFLCIAVAGYALVAYSWLEPGSTVAPAMLETYRANRLPILAHVFASVVALSVGPFQFFPSIRRRVKLHHRLGYIYFLAVLVGAVAGLVMSRLAQGGFTAQVGFGILSVLWLFTASMALQAIWNRDFPAHERWVVRNFALTFAAVSLRIYLPSFFALGYTFDECYPAVAWISWVPNLIIVEWFMLKRES